MKDKAAVEPVLELVRESKIYDLFPAGMADERLEASGVCFKEGCFYVIFDNSPHIARLLPDLPTASAENVMLRQRGNSAGFEDITFHRTDKRYLIILEAVAFGPNLFKPQIESYDESFRYQESRWVDFPLVSDNKGLEGLSYIQRQGQDYVFGMCEGNRCRGGAAGRKPGGGRIQIFQQGADSWEHTGTIKLPKSVDFEDYAALDVVDNRIAVVSQMGSRLWVGTFQESSWDFVDEGKVYQFPRDEKGKILYGNVEGVAWISPTQLVFVSDRRKAGEQSKRCGEKDQSIHIFKLPQGK